MSYHFVDLVPLPKGARVLVIPYGTSSLRCVLLTDIEYRAFVDSKAAPNAWLNVLDPYTELVTPDSGEWVVVLEGAGDAEVRIPSLAIPLDPQLQQLLNSAPPGAGVMPQVTQVPVYHSVPMAPPRTPGFVGPIAVPEPDMAPGLLSVAGLPTGLYGMGPAKPVPRYPGVTQMRVVDRVGMQVGVVTFGVDGRIGKSVAPGVMSVKTKEKNGIAYFSSNGTETAIASWAGWGDGSWEDFLGGVGKIAEFLYPVPEVYHNVTNWEDISTGEKFFTGVDVVGMVPGVGVIGKVLGKFYRVLRPAEKVERAVPPAVVPKPGGLPEQLPVPIADPVSIPVSTPAAIADKLRRVAPNDVTKSAVMSNAVKKFKDGQEFVVNGADERILIPLSGVYENQAIVNAPKVALYDGGPIRYYKYQGNLYPINTKIVYGHDYGFENWRLIEQNSGKMTQSEFNAMLQNDKFWRIEDTYGNASHLYEKPR